MPLVSLIGKQISRFGNKEGDPDGSISSSPLFTSKTHTLLGNEPPFLPVIFYQDDEP